MAEKKKKAQHGKKPDQKMKPFLVYEYLMRNSDENNIVKTEKIADYLHSCEISAERRSIYKDIEEINKAILIAEGVAIDILEAEEMCENEEERTIIFDKHRKGFYVRQRHYDVGDIRMLAECVYSARFLDEKTSKRLVDVVCDLVSENAAKGIKHTALLTDRVKTDCTTVYSNVSIINDAISRELNGEKHIPEKIKFKYLKHSIQDVKNYVERKHGAEYVVSPYELLINDGNYYLLAFDSNSQIMKTFRVDRMKCVKFTGEARDGEEVFKHINMATYAKEHFGMFGGNREHITLRFSQSLLDTIVDRFGTKDIVYGKDDEENYKAVVPVAVSEQFFGWVCGFGNKMQIVSPSPVVKEFKKYLDEMRKMYK